MHAPPRSPNVHDRGRTPVMTFAAWGLAWVLVAACCWPVVAATPVGQWVWSRRDLRVLEQARRVRPDVAAAISVAELRWDGAVTATLRLPPGLAGPPAMLVIRLDDSFHRAPAQGTGAQLEQAVGRVLGAVGPSQAATPVELDYDAPVARLADYAAWLDACRAGALGGRELWITSLPSHLDAPEFGALFAARVDGHVPQVFDTDVPWTPERADRLAAGIERAGLPFALGLGGFDRAGTDHAAWLAVVPQLATRPNFRGTWFFPAGFDWTPLLRRLP